MNHRITVAARSASSLLALVAIVAAACAPTPSSSLSPTTAAASSSPAPTTGAVATNQPSLSDKDAWRADLAMLVPGMAAIHPDLTHGVSRADLDSAVAALSSTVDTATDDQLMVGVLRIVAMVSAAGCDSHTGAFIWGTGTYPVESMPLRLWLFEDEVVVVDALPPYETLVGSRIDSIEGQPIADVLAAIDPIVPRDNAQTVRLLMPRFLLIPQVLRGLSLANDGAIALGLTATDEATSTVDVEPIPMADYNAWAGPYGLHLPGNPNVPYLSRIDDALWWERLADGTLFVQNNRTDRLPATVFTDLTAALHAPDVARVVVDLRHNYGGELSAVDEIEAPFKDPAVNQPDRLFVLTGRNTFSGGSLLVARLQRDTKAQIVGEPMGGCPTIWSDPTELALPFSGIVVNVADDVAVGVDPKDPRFTIEADVATVLTREDWAAGRDPALSLIVASAP
ncbi:MAG: hypothetical protein ABIZ52_02570 [Candidatus Limnocylindrales bacterium]